VTAYIDVRLVDRVAECFPRVATDDEPARLRHEGAHVSHVATDHDVRTLHRNTAPGSGFAFDHQQSTVRRRAGRLGCAALDPDHAAHHVLGDAGARVAV